VKDDDPERSTEIEQLRASLSEAKQRRRALALEMRDFVAMIGDIRTAFGKPYFYSGPNNEHPEHKDESVATYTGFNSHDVLHPTARAIKMVERELQRIKERLRALGVTVD
jgi:hypothetical protein